MNVFIDEQIDLSVILSSLEMGNDNELVENIC